jgi:hypothetical protein
MTILFLLSIVPMAVLWAQNNESSVFYVSTCLAGFVLILIMNIPPKRQVPFVKFEIEDKLLEMIIICLVGCGALFYVALLGFGNFNLDITKVYNFRAGFSSKLPLIFEYIHPLISKVFLPFLLLKGLFFKKRKLIIFSLLGYVIYFGFTQHRVYFFAPFAILLIVWLLKQSSEKIIKYIYLGNLAIVVLSFIFMWLGIHGYMEEYIIRRTYCIPAFLNYAYYDYFLDNEHIYWATSKLSLGYVDYNYDTSVAYVIGSYLGFDHAHANTGWFGSGYMQAGIFGIYFYLVLFIILFRFIDGTSKVNNLGLMSIPFLFLPVFWAFISTDLPTVFLTHGLLVALILLTFWKNKPKDTLEGQAEQAEIIKQ